MEETRFEKEFKNFMKISFLSFFISLGLYIIANRFKFPEYLVQILNTAVITSLVLCSICISLITIGVILYLKKEKEKRGNKNQYSRDHRSSYLHSCFVRSRVICVLSFWQIYDEKRNENEGEVWQQKGKLERSCGWLNTIAPYFYT